LHYSASRGKNNSRKSKQTAILHKRYNNDRDDEISVISFFDQSVFSARQHMRIARYVLSPVRPSVVCLSHEWISQKRLKLGSCNFLTG